MPIITWPVFLTATNVDPKALNEAWILLQDFEFGDSDDSGSWILITSTQLPETSPKPTRMLTTTEPIVDHDLAGSTMGDISDFVRTNETQLKELNISTLSWIIIDQNGLDCSSCILMHRQYDVEKMEMSHKFKAIRMPFIETWIMYANLDVANMDFEEWLDEDAGLQDDGTYKWIGPFPPSNEGLVQAEKEKEAKREACLKVAKDLGYIE